MSTIAGMWYSKDGPVHPRRVARRRGVGAAVLGAAVRRGGRRRAGAQASVVQEVELGVTPELSGAVVVTCGNASWPGEGAAIALPARPGRDELDPPLASLDGRRLVVCGTDADLAAVLLRLLRTETLGAVPVGYVPTSVASGASGAAWRVSAASAASAVARLWGLPADPARAAAVALHGAVHRVPLLRDDAGGVLVGRGVIRPVDGVVYCDDDLVLRGRAPWLEVQPDPEHGLVVRVARTGRLRRLVGLSGGRPRLAAGRAVQLGCEPTTAWRDGVETRTTDRWTWFCHTEDWQLALP
jgi:hypothetical protein